MFEEIHPNSEAFEAFKQFCFRIGEGRVEPQKMEIHFMHLYHPTVADAILIVHYDMMAKMIYIREFIEGYSIFNLEEFPLVHSFPVEGRPIFPYTVDVCKNEVIYYYYIKVPDTIPASMDMIMPEKASLDRYERFTLLFDEVNPIPWTERQNPSGELPPPGFPDLP